MTGDDLRLRLRRADPVREDADPGPPPSRTAHEILERAMQTIDDDIETRRSRPGWRRTPVLLAAGAAAAVAIGVGVVVSGGDLSGGDGTPGESEAPTTLALTAPPSDTMSSCMAFDVAFLAQMPVAFSGKATQVEGGTVTLDVERWYRGGRADVVTVSDLPETVALDGVDFEEGGTYLVTATDGMVNACGFSGPATPELESAFEQAFGS
jgi:hypothetical protein